jgi:predicted DNA-binding transcriptional regulator AlpA
MLARRASFAAKYQYQLEIVMASRNSRIVFGKEFRKDKKSIKRNHLRDVQLPMSGFVRLSRIVGDPHANPPIPALVAVGKSSWWLGVKNGRYPKGIKLGPRTTVWSLQAIHDCIQKRVVEGGSHD